MGNPRGVKRDIKALEQRRLAAAKMLRAGVPQAEVARRLGVSTASVCRWAGQLNREGVRGLKGAGRLGRKPRLTAQQTEQIKRKLKQGPEVLGYPSNLWTLPRVAHLIEQVCGVSYHPGHVWKLLRALGWSCQRPAKRAAERDEAEVTRWKRHVWPALKKKP